MQAIPNPYPIFLGLDGLALELGYIYIGTENLDPETNVKAVYWDEAGAQPATQPIRTLAGYPDSSGTPGQLWTLGKYSIRVRDSLGNQVFYLASAGESEAAGSGDPYHVHTQFLGDAPAAQQIIGIHVFGIDVSFEADLPALAFFHAATLPTGSAVCKMRHNGTQYGTMTVDTAGDITTTCDAVDFVDGDWFQLDAPDAGTDMADFAFTMVGAQT